MLQKRSLRFWIGFSMAVALGPAVISVFIGFWLLDRGVIASYADVSHRMHNQIAPVQRLRLHIQSAVVPVDEYLEDRQPQHVPAYRLLRQSIEEDYVSLATSLNGERQLLELLQRSRQDWTAADERASALLHTVRPYGDPALIESMLVYHASLETAMDKLSAMYEQLDRIVEHDYLVASRFYERSIWILGIAGFVSLVAVIFSVHLISRLMSASVDRLVEGAIRFAGGERDHRIEVNVPPELGRVAEEFNHMIERIHMSESRLAEMAHRDALTGLANRRAFDETLPEMLARADRFGDIWAV
ncbi:MAG: HAMP domain-containing protein, partial [Parahaliea sp.]